MPHWRASCLQMLRFLAGGVSTTAFSYAIYLLLLGSIGYLRAYSIAYAAGIAWSYLANTLFVFRRRPSVARALAFPLVYLAQFATGSALLVLMVDWLHWSAKAGPLVAVVLTLPLTYALSRWIITRPSPTNTRL